MGMMRESSQSPTRAGADVETIPDQETSTSTQLARPWNVIVLDDPITLMSYVTMVFQRLFGYPKPRAETLMLEVHTKGRAVVWTGGREQAETYVQRLHAYHLLAKLEAVDR